MIKSMNHGTECTFPVHVFIAGKNGQIGSALSQLLERQFESIAEKTGLCFILAGGANTQNLYLNANSSRPRTAGDWGAVADRLAILPSIFVDCSASPEVAAVYPQMLTKGIGVVTPNKIAFSGPSSQYHLLHALSAENGAPLVYNTTVGAALPIIGPLRELAARGEQPVKIEAVLSGTLSYIFARVNQGIDFSNAVREAWELGYSEPNPARDLAGEDTARKLVILLRAAGYTVEREEVAVEPVVTEKFLNEKDPARFVQALTRLDKTWRAYAKIGPLACVARYIQGKASVERISVLPNSAFARLEPRANLIQVYTQHYDSLPLTVSGPGAGVDITAAGVLSDLIAAGQELQATRGRFAYRKAV